MKERAASPEKQQSPTEAIAGVFKSWLSAEIASSMHDANAYLEGMGRDVLVSKPKANSHYDRMRLMTELFLKIEQDPKGRPDQVAQATARQIFEICIGLAGTYRTQCAHQANGQEEIYRHLRQEKGPLGISIGMTVSQRLGSRFGHHQPSEEDLSQEVIDLKDLVARSHATNEFRLQIFSNYFSDDGRNNAPRHTVHLQQFRRVQREWLGLGVDCVLYAAQRRNGDLSRVPFLTPTTITKTSIFYPFDEATQWRG